jgi:hypothetical protein
MYIETLKTDVIVLNGNIVLCLMLQWPLIFNIPTKSQYMLLVVDIWMEKTNLGNT